MIFEFLGTNLIYYSVRSFFFLSFFFFFEKIHQVFKNKVHGCSTPLRLLYSCDSRLSQITIFSSMCILYFTYIHNLHNRGIVRHGVTHLSHITINILHAGWNSRCCCKETPSTAGWNLDNYYLQYTAISKVVFLLARCTFLTSVCCVKRVYL